MEDLLVQANFIQLQNTINFAKTIMGVGSSNLINVKEFLPIDSYTQHLRNSPCAICHFRS